MEERLQVLRDDIQEVCKRYVQSKYFYDFSVSEYKLSFKHTTTTAHLTICFSTRYPDSSLLTDSSRPGYTKVFHCQLSDIMRFIETELYPSKALQHSNSDYVDAAEYLSSDYDSDEEYEGLSEESDVEDVTYTMHPLIARDLQSVREMYGEDSVVERVFDGIGDVDVDLYIDMSFLDADIAKAWKVKPGENLVVRVHLSMHNYLDGESAPHVDVFQPSAPTHFQFGVGQQMKRIVETFLQMQWRTLNNNDLAAIHEDYNSQNNNKKPGFMKQLSELIHSISTHGHNDPTTPDACVDDKALSQLLDMGFPLETSRNALTITRGNMDEATNLLVSSPESLECPREGNSSDCSRNLGVKRFNAEPCGDNPKVLARGFSQGKVAHDALVDLEMLSSSGENNRKSVPSLQNGFFVQLMKYCRQRVTTLNEFCVICDESHVFCSSMLKPAVCSRELCVFAFQTLGVMANVIEDLATDREVVNLLICMARAAVNNPRNNIIFDPYPTVVDPDDSKQLALDPKKKNYEKVKKCMKQMPTFEKVVKNLHELKTKMDLHDRLTYPLLIWIINSNRSHIVKLSKDKQLDFMCTPHQYLLLSSPPAIEKKFQDYKKKYGSTFVFHGSNIENWHSIIRNGLYVASGTKHQVNGAAHGKGIYLSPLSTVSLGYSGLHSSGAKSTPVKCQDAMLNADSNHLRCIALCEVINHNIKKASNSHIWVMPQEDMVCTRFFFVYDSHQNAITTCNTQEAAFKKSIQAAMMTERPGKQIPKSSTATA